MEGSLSLTALYRPLHWLASNSGFVLSKRSAKTLFFAVISIAANAYSNRLRFRRFFGGRNKFSNELQALDFAGIVSNSINHNSIFALEASLKQFLGKRILNVVLQRSSERSGTVIQVGTLLDQELFGFAGKFQFVTKL